MIPVLVVVGAILVLAFCGYRAAAGRNARIHKHRYYQRAFLVGAAAGVAVCAALGAATAALVAATPIYPELLAIGARMLVVIGTYATLVLAAVLVYVVAEHEVRTLATVAILGPFTLIRPAVIAAAAIHGLWPSRSLPATVLTTVSCALVLFTGALLDRTYGRRRLSD